jgi:hypothetical protein
MSSILYIMCYCLNDEFDNYFFFVHANHIYHISSAELYICWPVSGIKHANGQTDSPPATHLMDLIFLVPLNMGVNVPKDIRRILGVEAVNLRVTCISLSIIFECLEPYLLNMTLVSGQA